MKKKNLIISKNNELVEIDRPIDIRSRSDLKKAIKSYVFDMEVVDLWYTLTTNNADNDLSMKQADIENELGFYDFKKAVTEKLIPTKQYMTNGLKLKKFYDVSQGRDIFNDMRKELMDKFDKEF